MGMAVLCGGALFFLYFFGLTRTGLLGPDEPRYAAIGRAMADTGDWITPTLWGHPWFEKPALLYWMTAAGFKAGLGPDLAPRLPIALASVAFIVYFFIALRREFGVKIAFYAATILATSAGWLAYSHVGITDLPMSAAFAAAMLIVLPGPLSAGSALTAGVLLGFAVLAKGLVPLALFLPAVWFLRQRLRDLALLFSATALVALPWYVGATARNGAAFLEEFFWKHHFERFTSASLQHQQPFWFYLPVLVAGFFPWCPLLLLLFQRPLYSDRRARFLIAWLLWALLFFSISRNKLPGYLLPVLPAAAALLGIAIVQIPVSSLKLGTLLAASVLLFCFVPAIVEILPQALLSGVSHAHAVFPSGAWTASIISVAAAAIYLEKSGRRNWVIGIIAALAASLAFQIVWQVYPQLDRTVSARASAADSAPCVNSSNRALRYGLYYYAHRSLPDCN